MNEVEEARGKIVSYLEVILKESCLQSAVKFILPEDLEAAGKKMAELFFWEGNWDWTRNKERWKEMKGLIPGVYFGAGTSRSSYSSVYARGCPDIHVSTMWEMWIKEDEFLGPIMDRRTGKK